MQTQIAQLSCLTLLRSAEGTRETGWQLGDQETPDVLDKLHTSAPIPPSNVNASIGLYSHLQTDGNRPIHISATRLVATWLVAVVTINVTMTTTMMITTMMTNLCSVVFRQVIRTLFHRRPRGATDAGSSHRIPLFAAILVNVSWKSALFPLVNAE